MGRYLVPAAMVASAIAFAVAAATAGVAAMRSALWAAAVALVMLGGIIPIVFAVNIRIVPVFTRRGWQSEPRLRAQVILAIAGAWATYAGLAANIEWLDLLGRIAALAGAVLFAANISALLRQPVGRMPAPPLPFPEQAAVDRIATRFTGMAGAYLLFALAVALVTSVWRPPIGLWDLVSAHALLLGFFVSMAAGVCYHVLPRWTTGRWRAIEPIRWHLWLVVAGLPIMLLALATGWGPLFAVAGPVQAAAVALFLGNIAPLLRGLPRPTGWAFIAAGALLLLGVGFGAAFAIDPVVGARLRIAHADLNLFGFAGLLISGAAVYLGPRFAGRALRWPRLADAQVVLLAVGVVLAVAAAIWRAVGDGPAAAPLVAQGIVAASFALLAVVLTGTFTAPGKGTVSAVPVAPRKKSSGPGPVIMLSPGSGRVGR